MKTTDWCKTAILLGLLFTVNISFADEVRIRYHESLQQLTTQSLPVAADARLKIGEESQLTALKFNAFGKHFDISLIPNRRLLKNLAPEQRPENIGVYRGAVETMPGSWARIVMTASGPNGLVSDGETVYAIENDPETQSPIIFRLEDLEVPTDALSCSTTGKSKSAAGLLAKVSGEVAELSASNATLNLNIGLIADAAFTNSQGDAQAAMLTRMNNVDGIFSDQLGVQLTVNHSDVFDASNDPFSSTTDSGNLLDELALYRSSSSAQNANGLTHLFTGRDLDGSTVGIAYLNALCSSQFGAGLTQGTHSVTFDSLIAAHELGHNFGAPHDGTSGSACESEPQTFLMAPNLNGSDTFSACSISQMEDDVSRASCIAALPIADIAISIDEEPSNPLLGNQERISFAIDSIGTDDATDVTVDVSIPSNVTLDSISATSGSCTNGGGTASCDIGDVTAGSGFIVSVIATLDAVGEAEFVADVSASADTNAANNQVTATITIAPAVDLISTAASSSSITVNQSTTLRLTVENEAIIAATGVEVVISSDSGLQIDSASWSSGSCTVDSGVATCNAASLAANSSDTIDLDITGTAEGSHNYSIEATADETDRDTTNNEVSGSVTVTAASVNPGGNGGSGGNSSSDEGGGGGSLDWLFFGMLALYAGLIRRSANTR